MSDRIDQITDARAREEQEMLTAHRGTTVKTQAIVLRDGMGKIVHYIVRCVPSDWAEVLETRHHINLTGTPVYARAWLEPGGKIRVVGNDEKLRAYAQRCGTIFASLCQQD